MNFCPREFNSDMDDPRNLAYCHSIQRQDGEACRKKRCQYCVEAEPELTAEKAVVEQGSLFLPADHTKQNKTRP